MHHLSGNPNVISIKGAYEDTVAVHVVMELCTVVVRQNDTEGELYCEEGLVSSEGDYRCSGGLPFSRGHA